MLKVIIEDFVHTGEPVASSMIVEKYSLECSSATVRNDMVALEEADFLVKPHTSSGRVPTEKAYQYYVKNFVGLKQPNVRARQELQHVFSADDVRIWAKGLAEIMQRAIVFSDMERETYAGMTYFLENGELQSKASAHEIGQLLDGLHDLMQQIGDEISNDLHWYIGKGNPFGEHCTALVTRYAKNDHEGMILLLSPMRLDYDQSFAYMRYVKSLMR